MRIARLVLSGFRCFDTTPAIIELDDITTLIGANGAGKTALLHALCRLFGSSFDERRVRRSDFHVGSGDAADQALKASFFLEAHISFPELKAKGDALPGGVPDCFRHMILEVQGASPYCRVRLEAEWVADGTPEGTVSDKIFWVESTEDKPSTDHKREMKPYERSRIQVLYVPASRDPSDQLRNATGTLLFRLLRTVDWSTKASESVAEDARNTNDILAGEAGVNRIEQVLAKRWRDLYDERWSESPRLRFARGRLQEILRQVDLVFSPSLDGEAHDASRLSDGLRSLFYFSLVGTVFELERMVKPVSPSATGDDEAEAPAPAVRARLTPALTVFAVEEPEAHLAPHQLARIMKLFSEIAAEPAAQVVLSSHAPGIVRRVKPQHVRYVRRDLKNQVASVRKISLPAEADTASKFIRQAVQVHPELYFARMVVLGEGDSEDVVLPILARAHGLDIDVAFVSIVPLGGRHVNHLWKLLTDLDIPFVTLLDLDRERAGAGWGRIKYVIQRLTDIGKASQVMFRPGAAAPLTETELEAMHKRPVTDTAEMDAWIAHLETFDVFFSAPLDLDFTMLEAFTVAYQNLEEGDTGPATTEGEAVTAVLGKKATGSTYSSVQLDLLRWYNYLFLNRSKPATHLAAMTDIEPEVLALGTPAVLKRLIDRAIALLATTEN